MEMIIISSLLSFIITLLVIPVIISIARIKKLYDEPDKLRKFHKEPIPALGGVGMFIGFVISILLTLNFSLGAGEFQYYLSAFLLIFFLGIKDDIQVLSAWPKFLGQVIAASILVLKAGLLIDNMHGFLGIYQLSNSSSILFSIFSIVVIINAFNLIDGVDGLAGSIGLISSLLFSLYFLINQNLPYSILGFSLAGSLVAFLLFNMHPAKIFMGDTGSLIVGIVNSILVLKFIETAGTYTLYPLQASPAIGFGILLIPLMDTLRVFAIRVKNKRSPFSPDRLHLHHLLLNRGCSHKRITGICIVVTLCVSVITFFLQQLGTGYLIALQILFFFVFVYIINTRKSKHNLRVVKGEMKQDDVEKEVTMIPLFDKNPVNAKED